MTKPSLLVQDILVRIPEGLRSELFSAYNDILRHYRELRWEPSELNGGKLCEIVYSIVKGYLDGKFPSKSQKPSNMLDACKALEQFPSTFPRSARIQIPRMLIALYEIRNNRNVGHVGGDVNPNHMDATAVLFMSKWLVAELVRLFHGVSTDAASAAVDLLVERKVPVVWRIDEKYRILSPKLSMKQKTLLILYQINKSVLESDLIQWVEHTNSSVYRRDILRKSHKDKLIEYDPGLQTVRISPKGVLFVEQTIPFELE